MLALIFQLNVTEHGTDNQQVDIILRTISLSNNHFVSFLEHTILAAKKVKHFNKNSKVSIDYPTALISKHKEFRKLLKEHQSFDFFQHSSSSNEPSSEQQRNQQARSRNEIEKELKKVSDNIKEQIRKLIDDSLFCNIDHFLSDVSLIYVESDDPDLRKLFFHYLELFRQGTLKNQGISYLVKKRKELVGTDENLIIRKEGQHNINLQPMFANCNGLNPEEDLSIFKKFRKKIVFREFNILEQWNNINFIDFKTKIRDQKIDILYFKFHETLENEEQKIPFQDGNISILEFCDGINLAKNIKLIMLMSCNSQDIAEQIIQNTKCNHIIATKEIINQKVISDFLQHFFEILEEKVSKSSEIILASILREAQQLIHSPTDVFALTSSVLAIFQNSNSFPLTWIEDNNKISKVKFFRRVSVLSVLGLGVWLGYPHLFPGDKNGNMEKHLSKNLEETIQQSTVQIQSSANKRDLGVIIAKEENNSQPKLWTYYILTQKDVFQSNNTKENYFIKTVLEKSKIKIEEYYTGDNFAIARFKSETTYLIPTLIQESEAYETHERVYGVKFLENKFSLLDHLQITDKIADEQTIQFRYKDTNSNINPDNGMPLFNADGCLLGLHNEPISQTDKYRVGISIKSFLEEQDKYEQSQSLQDISTSWKILEKLKFCEF